MTTSLELTSTETADFDAGDVYFIGNALGFDQGHALDTWEAIEVRKGEATLTITAMPGKHAIEFLSGLDDFKKAAGTSTTTTRFVYLTHGEGLHLRTRRMTRDWEGRERAVN